MIPTPDLQELALMLEEAAVEAEQRGIPRNLVDRLFNAAYVIPKVQEARDKNLIKKAETT